MRDRPPQLGGRSKKGKPGKPPMPRGKRLVRKKITLHIMPKDHISHFVMKWAKERQEDAEV